MRKYICLFLRIKTQYLFMQLTVLFMTPSKFFIAQVSTHFFLADAIDSQKLHCKGCSGFETIRKLSLVSPHKENKRHYPQPYESS